MKRFSGGFDNYDIDPGGSALNPLQSGGTKGHFGTNMEADDAYFGEGLDPFVYNQLKKHGHDPEFRLEQVMADWEQGEKGGAALKGFYPEVRITRERSKRIERALDSKYYNAKASKYQDHWGKRRGVNHLISKHNNQGLHYRNPKDAGILRVNNLHPFNPPRTRVSNYESDNNGRGNPQTREYHYRGGLTFDNGKNQFHDVYNQQPGVHNMNNKYGKRRQQPSPPPFHAKFYGSDGSFNQGIERNRFQQSGNVYPPIRKPYHYNGFPKHNQNSVLSRNNGFGSGQNQNNPRPQFGRPLPPPGGNNFRGRQQHGQHRSAPYVMNNHLRAYSQHQGNRPGTGIYFEPHPPTRGPFQALRPPAAYRPSGVQIPLIVGSELDPFMYSDYLTPTRHPFLQRLPPPPPRRRYNQPQPPKYGGYTPPQARKFSSPAPQSGRHSPHGRAPPPQDTMDSDTLDMLLTWLSPTGGSGFAAPGGGGGRAAAAGAAAGIAPVAAAAGVAPVVAPDTAGVAPAAVAPAVAPLPAPSSGSRARKDIVPEMTTRPTFVQVTERSTAAASTQPTIAPATNPATTPVTSTLAFFSTMVLPTTSSINLPRTTRTPHLLPTTRPTSLPPPTTTHPYIPPVILTSPTPTTMITSTATLPRTTQYRNTIVERRPTTDEAIRAIYRGIVHHSKGRPTIYNPYMAAVSSKVGLVSRYKASIPSTTSGPELPPDAPYQGVTHERAARPGVTHHYPGTPTTDSLIISTESSPTYNVGPSSPPLVYSFKHPIQNTDYLVSTKGTISKQRDQTNRVGPSSPPLVYTYKHPIQHTKYTFRTERPRSEPVTTESHWMPVTNSPLSDKNAYALSNKGIKLYPGPWFSFPPDNPPFASTTPFVFTTAPSKYVSLAPTWLRLRSKNRKGSTEAPPATVTGKPHHLAIGLPARKRVRPVLTLSSFRSYTTKLNQLTREISLMVERRRRDKLRVIRVRTQRKDKAQRKDNIQREDRTQSEGRAQSKDWAQNRDTAQGSDWVQTKGIAGRKDWTREKDATQSKDRTQREYWAKSEDIPKGNDRTQSKDRTPGKDRTQSKDRTPGKDRTQSKDNTQSKDMTQGKGRAQSKDKHQKNGRTQSKTINISQEEPTQNTKVEWSNLLHGQNSDHSTRQSTDQPNGNFTDHSDDHFTLAMPIYTSTLDPILTTNKVSDMPKGLLPPVGKPYNIRNRVLPTYSPSTVGRGLPPTYSRLTPIPIKTDTFNQATSPLSSSVDILSSEEHEKLDNSDVLTELFDGDHSLEMYGENDSDKPDRYGVSDSRSDDSDVTEWLIGTTTAAARSTGRESGNLILQVVSGSQDEITDKGSPSDKRELSTPRGYIVHGQTTLYPRYTIPVKRSIGEADTNHTVATRKNSLSHIDSDIKIIGEEDVYTINLRNMNGKLDMIRPPTVSKSNPDFQKNVMGLPDIKNNDKVALVLPSKDVPFTGSQISNSAISDKRIGKIYDVIAANSSTLVISVARSLQEKIAILRKMLITGLSKSQSRTKAESKIKDLLLVIGKDTSRPLGEWADIIQRILSGDPYDDVFQQDQPILQNNQKQGRELRSS